MAFDPNRYVQGDQPTGDPRTPREKLMDLMEAHTRATGRDYRDLERESERARQDYERNWGNEALQGAAAGGAMSGSPWGALAGGILGTVRGMSGAYRDRRRSGQGKLESLGRTLFDVPRSLPDFSTSAPASVSLGRTFQGRKGADFTLGFDKDTLEALTNRPTKSHGDVSSPEEFKFQDPKTSTLTESLPYSDEELHQYYGVYE